MHTIRTAIQILTILACAFAPAMIDAKEAAVTLRPDIKAERVMFIGNSITHNGPMASIGWNSDWGMAATSQDNDYVHVTVKMLTGIKGRPPQFVDRNIAEFERNLATYDLGALKDEVGRFKPDLVVIAIGENVPALGSDAAKTEYAKNFARLLTAVGDQGRKIVVRSCFWAEAAKDAIMKNETAAAGGIFVDISALGGDESNYARSERAIAHAGVARHPGDKGMKAIADAIVKALESPAK